MIQTLSGNFQTYGMRLKATFHYMAGNQWTFRELVTDAALMKIEARANRAIRRAQRGQLTELEYRAPLCSKGIIPVITWGFNFNACDDKDVAFVEDRGAALVESCKKAGVALELSPDDQWRNIENGGSARLVATFKPLELAGL